MRILSVIASLSSKTVFENISPRGAPFGRIRLVSQQSSRVSANYLEEMMRLSIGTACLFIVVNTVADAQIASSTSPLVEITTLDSHTYIFDVSKVTAVTFEPQSLDAKLGPPFAPGRFGDKATQIYGVVTRPLAVKGSTNDFLTKYGLDKKFILVQGTLNEVNLKASAISLIEPHSFTEKEAEACIGETDGSSCSTSEVEGIVKGICHKVPISNDIGCSSQIYNADVFISEKMWSVSDEPEALKQKINDKLSKPN